MLKVKASEFDGKFSDAIELHEIKIKNTRYLSNLDIIKDNKLYIVINYLTNYTLWIFWLKM